MKPVRTTLDAFRFFSTHAFVPFADYDFYGFDVSLNALKFEDEETGSFWIADFDTTNADKKTRIILTEVRNDADNDESRAIGSETTWVFVLESEEVSRTEDGYPIGPDVSEILSAAKARTDKAVNLSNFSPIEPSEALRLAIEDENDTTENESLFSEPGREPYETDEDYAARIDAENDAEILAGEALEASRLAIGADGPYKISEEEIETAWANNRDLIAETRLEARKALEASRLAIGADGPYKISDEDETERRNAVAAHANPEPSSWDRTREAFLNDPEIRAEEDRLEALEASAVSSEDKAYRAGFEDGAASIAAVKAPTQVLDAKPNPETVLALPRTPFEALTRFSRIAFRELSPTDRIGFAGAGENARIGEEGTDENGFLWLYSEDDNDENGTVLLEVFGPYEVEDSSVSFSFSGLSLR